MNQLVDLVYLPLLEWEDHARDAVAQALSERYSRVTADTLLDARGHGEKRFQVRLNAGGDGNNVPFLAIIGPDQETSGPYGGMSFVLFPSREEGVPALIGMVVGTNGLAPDEDILGRPGHARKVRAICSWLRSRGAELAWAKQDPVRIDLRLPKALGAPLDRWKPACDRYGQVLYAAFVPPERSDEGDALVHDALCAFLDLFFDERRIQVMSRSHQESERIRRGWLSTVLPDTTDEQVAELLAHRKYAILEGPPGTGKTELATRLLETRYGGRGRIIQFHPGTTYESFIGGLAPKEGGEMGFTFKPAPGHLMEAAVQARKSDEPWLLVIDEINRADLSKVLGEAIYLFEPGRHDREVRLPYNFGEPMGAGLSLPPNLHVLGTMNSADRSIAILDLAVRRRFAFAKMWPQLAVVETHGGGRLQKAFHHLLLVFLEHASDDAFSLMPGHAYFLGNDEVASRRLQTEVVPLLEEYLAQGYVAPFADEVQAWLDTVAEAT